MLEGKIRANIGKHPIYNQSSLPIFVSVLLFLDVNHSHGCIAE